MKDRLVCSFCGFKLTPAGGERAGEGCPSHPSNFLSVADLAAGEEAWVVEINYQDPRQLRKLLAVGILPGTRITLLQHFPVYVLQVGWTKIALDKRLAQAVWVSRSDRARAGNPV